MEKKELKDYSFLCRWCLYKLLSIWLNGTFGNIYFIRKGREVRIMS